MFDCLKFQRFPGIPSPLVVAACFTILAALPAPAFDFEKPPTADDRRALIDQGFPESLKILEAGLVRFDNPQKKGARPSKDSGFAQWMDLWRWCELLARDVPAEETALVQRHFFRRSGTGQVVLCPPGVTPPPDGVALHPGEAAGMAAAPDVRQAVLRNLLPPETRLEGASLADVAGASLAADVMSDPEFLRAFFSTWDSRDFAPLVLKNLRDIREAHPGRWTEYANLAIAIAAVNDSALPPYWPHHQVRSDLVPREVPAPADQFGRWVEANASGRLLHDLRRFSAGQLTFVVDAFLASSEIAWAKKNIPFHIGIFGRAFSSIRYREDRIKSRRFFWNEEAYTFAAIRKRGGICIDQAYYAAYAGKALGLPTVLFNGQGSNGGHAWFGYMSGVNKWELDCGRDPSQNLVTGIALDPRTWQPVSDHVLRQLAARFRSTPAFLASTNDLAMARILLKSGDTLRAAVSLENAARTCPQNPEAWMRWTEFLETSGAPVVERIRIHEQAVKALSRDPDSRVLHQQAAADLHRASGNAGQAQATENRILTQNLGNRSDLSCEAAAARVREALAAEGIDKAALVFHSQLRSIGKAGGGNFVKEVGVPFVTALVEKNQKSRALRTVEIMRRQFAPLNGSPLDLALKEMGQQCR